MNRIKQLCHRHKIDVSILLDGTDTIVLQCELNDKDPREYHVTDEKSGYEAIIEILSNR